MLLTHITKLNKKTEQLNERFMKTKLSKWL